MCSKNLMMKMKTIKLKWLTRSKSIGGVLGETAGLVQLDNHGPGWGLIGHYKGPVQ